jgi:isocitrate dehydrogenase (NAD+)
MHYPITLLPGDGIGPEVSRAAVQILEATGLDIAWDSQDAGLIAAEKGLPTLPDATLESIRKNRVALKAPITTPVGKGFSSVNVGLRKALSLYVSLRPVRSWPGLETRHPNVNLVVFRENTEGLYAGREHEVVPGVVEALKIVTREASIRIAKYAYDYARWTGRNKITVVHKKAVMKLSDGLFVDCCREVASRYPFIETEEMPIDQVAMNLVIDPSRFQIILTDNLFGDILSDLCSGLVGGLGIVPGANIGEESAVFEAVHGSAPDIAGQNKANPIALVLSAAMMLHHIGAHSQGARVETAVERVLADQTVRTGDLGGSATTSEMTQAIIDALPTQAEVEV